MSCIFVSSYEGKLFLDTGKLEWLKSKHYADENIFICSQEPYRAVNFDKRPCNTILCAGEIFTDRTLASSGYTTLYFGEGGPGFLTL
jgi:hypothetical protein